MNFLTKEEKDNLDSLYNANLRFDGKLHTKVIKFLKDSFQNTEQTISVKHLTITFNNENVKCIYEKYDSVFISKECTIVQFIDLIDHYTLLEILEKVERFVKIDIFLG